METRRGGYELSNVSVRDVRGCEIGRQILRALAVKNRNVFSRFRLAFRLFRSHLKSENVLLAFGDELMKGLIKKIKGSAYSCDGFRVKDEK